MPNASATPKNVVVLGATGSIGGNALRVLRAHPDKLRLVGVAARANGAALAAVCREFGTAHASLYAPGPGADEAFPAGTTLHPPGEEGLRELAALEDADLVLVAVTGTHGLRPTLDAIAAGKDVALANKELLVLGGRFVTDAARERGVRLLPADSEHNAIFQCLQGDPDAGVGKLVLTASGGPFRDRDPADLAHVTPREATAHPTWSMGPKITVDSATMANKGLELFEAHWLFGAAPDQLEVVLHAQSVVHSLVQFLDGSILAQLSPPSMTFAIQHCLLYPERAAGVDAALDFTETFALDFAPPRLERYPCLRLAYDAMRAGPPAMAIFNAANEVAVERFLENRVGFLEIANVIESTLERLSGARFEDFDALLQLDAEARRLANDAAGGA